MAKKKRNSQWKVYVIPVLIILAAVIIALAAFSGESGMKSGEVVDVVVSNEGDEIKITEDGTKYIVDPGKIRSGGPPKDGIPSIDNPRFVGVSEADEWIAGNELVIAFEHKGVKRVYPLQIMVWHEIVNDNIAGEPVLITWCPLCGSAIAFRPEISVDGETKSAEFGTSGKLYNSNLVMYDRETDTYWSQIDGKAIVGELTGQQLEELDINVVPWRDWKAVHEDSEVLSQDTGFNRNYGRDPYGNYYEDSFLFFPVEAQDSRIHNKDVIFGIEIDGVFAAYREEDVKEQGTIDDEVNGVNIRLEAMEDGSVLITHVDTGEKIAKERDFWFAWYAFHPETRLYGFDE